MIKTIKLVCTGCGKDRPCYLEINQEQTDYVRDDVNLITEDLKCVLDSTNQTSYNWKEVIK